MNPKEAEKNLVKTVEKFLLNNGTVGTKRQDWPDRLKRKKLTATAKFKEDLGMDSLDTVELIMQFEEEFDIEISDDDAEKLTTVGSSVDYINNKLA